MNQSKGLIYFFLSPFIPFIIFRKITEIDTKKFYFFLAFLASIIISIGSYYLYHNTVGSKFHNESEPFVYIGFFLGTLTRFFLLSYFTWIMTRKMSDYKIAFSQSFNITLLATLPVSLGIIMAFIDTKFYDVMFIIGHLWSLSILAIGLSILAKLNAMKAISIAAICGLLLLFTQTLVSGLTF